MSPHHFKLGETDQARWLVRQFHYTNLYPSAVALVGTWHDHGGLFGDSGPAYAACVFGYPSFGYGMQTQRLLELTRLVQNPDYHEPLTGLIAETVTWIRRKSLADLLISYADRGQDHHGGIYQAASWNYHHEMAQTKSTGNWFINGEKLSDRTVNHRYGTQSITKLRARGLQAEREPVDHTTGKHLYWRPLNRAGKRIAGQIGLSSSPYPKPCNQET